ncbi:hypothetical protein [Halanaerobaculum tunisiense]
MYQELISLFLQSIPESIALVFSAVVFLKVTIDRRVVFIGLIQGLMVYFFRSLPITFGFHTILSLISYTILLTFFYKRRVLESFVSILKTIILLSIFEILTMNILVHIIDKPIEVIIENQLWKTIAMMPQIILLFLVGYIILQIRQKKE